MKKIENREEWGWYVQELDVTAKYRHQHNGEPERFPCLVKSQWWDDPNGPYSYDHSFIYQKENKCDSCGHSTSAWDMKEGA